MSVRVLQKAEAKIELANERDLLGAMLMKIKGRGRSRQGDSSDPDAGLDPGKGERREKRVE